ncbi:MAG: SAM-dependent methyltransferase [Bacteroidetes bacterium]|nr:MAG: SAM-dependent methyltransferase [Bacteroidota bacterium]
MSQLGDYINYQIHAKTRHGIHSPFVYNFVEQYLYKKLDSSLYRPIEDIRKELLKNGQTIQFEDLGAGSKKRKTKTPTIKSLAKNSLKPKKYAKLIAQLAQYIEAKSIIELGTSLGTTALYISKLNPKSQIYTIEGSPEIGQIAKQQFNKLNAKNIELIVGNFDDQLQPLLEKIDTVDLIFIDGNHTQEATLRYFELALKYCHDKTLFIFDDIYWSEGMKQAWSTIKNHPKVSLSMDFFFLGVVSINPDFSKEEFLIRY